MLTLGAHLSVASGYTKAMENLVQMGGNSLQIFSSSPRGWNFANLDPIDSTQFNQTRLSLQINPIYFHASYLINLADNGRVGHLSKLSLIAELSIASKLHIRGSVVHTGSFRGEKTDEKMKTVIVHIKEILEKTPDDSFLIIENAGNRKIGQSLEEIEWLVKNVDNPRVKVCLDTCHLYAAGYDIGSDEKLNIFLDDFEKRIGLEKLELFHLNDSRDPFESGRDRHENIGQGSIGLSTFRSLVQNPRTSTLPFILETPGFADSGPDKQNIDIVKSLCI